MLVRIFNGGASAPPDCGAGVLLQHTAYARILRDNTEDDSGYLDTPSVRRLHSYRSSGDRLISIASSHLISPLDAMAVPSGAVWSLIASFALAAILAWSATTISVHSDANSKSHPVLLFAGDSLTEKGTDPATDGWITLLQSRYRRSTDIITRGLSGYNTKWFLKDVVPLIEREMRVEAYTTPSLFTVWLGANDAALWNGSNSETHIPIEEYTRNLVKIVGGLWTAAPTAHVLLVTPPHVNDTAREEIADERNDPKRGLVDRSNAVTKQYAQACVQAASSIGVPVLDLNAFFNAMSETSRNALLVDGLHFNAEGNAVVNEQLRSKIAAEFPALDEIQVWQFPPASSWAV